MVRNNMNVQVGLSIVAGLFVAALIGTTPALAQQRVLAIDFNDRDAAGPGTTEPGFDEFLITAPDTPTTLSFGAIDVTLSRPAGTDNRFDDRRRDTPLNDGAFTEQELLRDFIFFRGLSPDDGLDLLIAGLSPGLEHEIRIWSFDTGSGPTRVSDWAANGILVQDDYSFDGGTEPPSPTDNDVYSFDFTSIADGNGEILIEGRYVSGNCCGVFINAVTVDSVIPEPSTLVLAACGLLGLAGFGRRRRRQR